MKADPFGASRKRLLGIAYRMLSSRTEAEDVLQDAWLRFNGVRDVQNRERLLTTIVTRLCLDRLKSAQARREAYTGPWLPEPIADTAALSPDAPTELADDLSFALLLTLERLTPAERAAFLLHDVFDMPFSEVALILGKSEAASRQLATRARKSVREARPAYRPPADTHRRLLAAFGMAVSTGDVAALSRLFHEDAVMVADGGGKVLTALNPITGADRIARFFIGTVRKFGSQMPELQIEWAEVNGSPAIVARIDESIAQVLQLAIREYRIAMVYVVRNPDKLAWLRGGTLQ